MKGKVLLLLGIFFSTSCRNTSTKTAEFVFSDADSIPVSEAEKLSPESKADISMNISSPVEMSKEQLEGIIEITMKISNNLIINN